MTNYFMSDYEKEQVESNKIRDNVDNSFCINAKYPPAGLKPLVSDYISNLKIGTDNTERLQNIIDYVMNSGGGCIYIPAGKYRVSGTVYTHSLNLDLTKKTCRLQIDGCMESSSVGVGNRSSLIKSTAGPIFAVNYNTSETGKIGVIAYPAVYDRFIVKNITFLGGGVPDAKYNNEYSSSLGGIGIQAHFARLTVEGCAFWGLDYGIYEPLDIIGATDKNYCDLGVFRNLSFSCIATGCIGISQGDQTIIDGLLFVGGISSVNYLVDIYLGMSVSIKNIICSGHGLLRCTDLNVISLRSCRSSEVANIYIEHIAKRPVYIYNCHSTDIKGIYIRQHGPTIVSHFVEIDTCVGVTMQGLTGFFTENLQLSASDVGDYKTYDTVTAVKDVSIINSSNIICKQNRIQPGAYNVGTGALEYNGSARDITSTPDNLSYATSLRSATLVIASSTSLGKWTADYICDGIADHGYINSAIAELPASGGKIVLLEGTYAIGAPIYLLNNITIEGQGTGTILRIIDGLNIDISVFAKSASIVSGFNSVWLKNMVIDGNKVNNDAGNQKAINLASGTNLNIKDVTVKNTRGSSVVLSQSSLCTIDNVRVSGSDSSGIYFYTTIRSIIKDSFISGNILHGIFLDAACEKIIIQNSHVFQNGQNGIILAGASIDNNILNNLVYENSQTANNTYSGINISSGNYNNIQTNIIRYGNLTNKHKYGINISSSASCTGNIATNNDLYLSGSTSSLNDIGTGTITTSGNRL